MFKLLSGLLAFSSVSSFAMSNNLFQEFDNQVNIGFGINQAVSGFGTNPRVVAIIGNIITQTNIVNFEAERLFNNGVWIDINANMAFGAGPVGKSNYQNPSDYGINGKVGYAFTMAGNQHLQLTPYGLVGLNRAASNFVFPVVANPQVANSFDYTLGVGGRIEYRINRAIMLYADQLVAYNWDQSGPTSFPRTGTGGIMPQNFMGYTSTLGAKFNVVKNFQIGVRGYYTNYQPMASNAVNTTGVTLFGDQPQNAFGGIVSVGLTY